MLMPSVDLGLFPSVETSLSLFTSLFPLELHLEYPSMIMVLQTKQCQRFLTFRNLC